MLSVSLPWTWLRISGFLVGIGKTEQIKLCPRELQYKASNHLLDRYLINYACVFVLYPFQVAPWVGL